MSWTSDAELFASSRNVLRATMTWRRVLLQLKAFRGRSIILILTVVVGVAATLIQPFLFRIALDIVLPGQPQSARPQISLTAVSISALIIGMVGVAAGFIEQRFRITLSEDITKYERQEQFERFERLPYGFFVHANPGAIMDRMWTESARSGMSLVYVIAEGTRSIFTLIVGPLLIAIYDPVVGVVLGFMVLFLLPSRWIRGHIKSAMVEQVAVQARYVNIIQECLSVPGVLLTHVLNLHRSNSANLQRRAMRYRELEVTAGTWSALNQAFLASGLALAVPAIIWFGGNAVTSGKLTIGGLTLFLFYIRILAAPIQNYGQLRFELVRCLLAFRRIFEVLDLPDDGRPELGANKPSNFRGRLEFESVRFRYPTARSLVPQTLALADRGGEEIYSDAEDPPETVLAGVTFSIAPGAFVALAGSSGSGKSTVAALAAGLLTPSEGRVLIGGEDVRKLDRITLTQETGLVTQDTHLIHDSIRANLLLARPGATEKELVRACVTAGIHSFIRGLPNGYSTIVGERGIRLSGGQRQRVAFARILLLDPQIVILDEATAHLDAESEALLREGIDRVLAGRTRLVIAHRLSTIIDADEILVLENGIIVERGTHKELISTGGRYQQLCQAQFLNDGPKASPQLRGGLSNESRKRMLS